MDIYKHDVVVFKINKKSRRGFYFKEEVVDRFLNSKKCRDRLDSKSSLGISTHFERLPDDKLKGKIPTEDRVLYDRSFTHFISRFYKKDGYFMAEITFLDPELFEGETRERIKFITGLLKSGVRLSTSAGIEAYYNPLTKEGEEIYDIIGVDFTMAPDFEDSKVI